MNRSSTASLLSCVLLLFASAAACRPAAPSGPGKAPGNDVTLVLRGALFQSGSGRVLQEAVVVVAGDRVVCSGVSADCPYPAAAPLREIEGGTILPGLIDLHVHARPHYVGAFLPAGVTTVRDASNTLAVVDSLRAAPGGPRVLASGPLVDGPTSTMLAMSPTAGPLGEHPFDQHNPILVADSAAAAAAIEALADEGVDLIKLYQRLPEDAFESAMTAARERGLDVAADLGMVSTGGLQGSEIDIVDGARAGVTTIEHLSGLALAYRRHGGDPLARPHDAAILDGIARDLLDTGVTAVPTLANMIQFAEPEALPWREAPGARLAPFFEGHWQALIAMAAARPEVIEADRDLTRELLRRLHDGGMLIGAGSDMPAAPNMPPGGALHLELEALVRAGLTPAEALQAATANAAEILGRPDLGHLGAGARADILVVDGDPTREISATRRIRSVWLDGREVDLEAAWQATERAARAAMESAPSPE